MRKLLCVCCMAILCLSGCGSDYSQVLQKNWGFALPENAAYKEVYKKDSGASFHGDGIRYHVYSYQEEAPIAAMFDDWIAFEKEPTLKEGYIQTANTWLDEIEVPKAERPDYTDCKIQADSQSDESRLLVVWNSAADRLYILEFFI